MVTLDVIRAQSTFEGLFKSNDPHFYGGIAEYEMLKRGMTHEEKIEA